MQRETIYILVDVKKELPTETRKVAVIRKGELDFAYAMYFNEGKNFIFDHFKQGGAHNQSEITHWLKPIEVVVETDAEIETKALEVYPKDLHKWADNPPQYDDMNAEHRAIWIGGYKANKTHLRQNNHTLGVITNLMERWHLGRDNDEDTLGLINDALVEIGGLKHFNKNANESHTDKK